MRDDPASFVAIARAASPTCAWGTTRLTSPVRSATSAVSASLSSIPGGPNDTRQHPGQPDVRDEPARDLPDPERRAVTGDAEIAHQLRSSLTSRSVVITESRSASLIALKTRGRLSVNRSTHGAGRSTFRCGSPWDVINSEPKERSPSKPHRQAAS
ncbi:hypothetical protein [Baekduia alba]|uniref:hypothetical protein n=1 Tax=Baekduia alba TaxID=2997333 RepID=UPI002341E952|nr:hypothetical protein [Baekduia alba]